MTPGGRRSAVIAALIALLAVSYALRVALVLGGGQGFWPDESRYLRVLEAVQQIAGGDVAGGLQAVVGRADHLGFKLLALVPASLQAGLGLSLAAPAGMLALASTFDVLLVYRIARRAGADGLEALGAALAMAGSNAMFYWSRHLVPYDIALACGLALVYVGLKREVRARDSILAGALGFATFFVYNGYWSLAVSGFALHASLALPDMRATARRTGWMLVGFAGSAALAVLALRQALGFDLLSAWRGWSGIVTQGDLDDGHGMVFGYVWEAERALALVWGLVAVAVPLAWLRGRRVDGRAWIWLACALGIVALLVAGSNLLGKFVVYGRLVRQSIPFLSLLTGYVLFGPWRRGAGAGWRAPLAAVALGLIAALNFAAPLRLTFPAEFVARGRALLAERDGVAPAAVDTETGRHLFVNTRFLWPMPPRQALPEGARVLLQAPHPQHFRPYLYEGCNRRQRAAFLRADLDMKLIEVE